MLGLSRCSRTEAKLTARDRRVHTVRCAFEAERGALCQYRRSIALSPLAHVRPFLAVLCEQHLPARPGGLDAELIQTLIEDLMARGHLHHFVLQQLGKVGSRLDRVDQVNTEALAGTRIDSTQKRHASTSRDPSVTARLAWKERELFLISVQRLYPQPCHLASASPSSLSKVPCWPLPPSLPTLYRHLPHSKAILASLLSLSRNSSFLLVLLFRNVGRTMSRTHMYAASLALMASTMMTSPPSTLSLRYHAGESFPSRHLASSLLLGCSSSNSQSKCLTLH